MGRLAALNTNRVTRAGMATVLGLGSVAGLGLAADAATGRVRTGGDNLVVRSGPGTSYAKVGRISSGTRIDIICQTRGTTVKGRYGTSSWWNKIGQNRYVSDAFVYTGSDGRVAPLCTSGSTNPAPASAVKDDYPYRGATSGVDRWNFYKGQCTSFAAWRVNHNLGIGFHNHYRGVRWSNAQNWDNAARAVGIPVHGTPRVGDIAVRDSGTWGHVAYVAKVNTDGSFMVEEYNWARPDTYSYRKATRGEGSGQFSSFIRFTR
ncbi:CHAP domain-containing protein [Knoellia sp. 3-2P3]|uniref:CHAP domain-containing protein n=1 Tax=unclassified Knoellia TaxID=2618719 RepID=UPI0023DB9777|nr:CHAP domain-containing protein [Knoellia sp. 3-2P3]MDF2091132.1 CHAP domain-containing protein [Knoellia sp. 3-2P3]